MPRDILKEVVWVVAKCDWWVVMVRPVGGDGGTQSKKFEWEWCWRSSAVFVGWLWVAGVVSDFSAKK